MNITLTKNADGKYEIKMIGRLDECNVVVEALENSVNETKPIQEATKYLRKKINENSRR